MKRKYGIYYYNANKQPGNDLGLKLYSKGYDTELAAERDIGNYNIILDIVESKFIFIVLPYFEK
jgi:hypothetical protein